MNFKPTSKKELIQLIEYNIDNYGYECDLNHIDTSLITDMSRLFFKSKFNGKIDKWIMSNVLNTNCMFFRSKFNGDVSKWQLEKIINASNMFYGSEFNNDISMWVLPNNVMSFDMFTESKYSYDLPKNINSSISRNMDGF